MNKAKVTSLICGGMISLLGTSLLAQQSSSSTLGQSSSSSSGQSSSLGTSSSQRMHSGKNVRLSHLMNATVKSQQGQQLGYIKDFTVEPQSGQISFAILSLSPTAGGTSSSTTAAGQARSAITGAEATGKLVPVPWQLFSQSWSSSQAGLQGAAGTPSLTLNVDESKLQSAPSFQASNWNEIQQSSFDHQVYSHFGVNPMSSAGMPGSSVSGQGTSGTKDYGTEQNSSQPQR